jgi:hypothetical protein
LRRVLGVITLVAAAGIFIPAAAVAAVALPARPSPQRFGVRLVDVPVSEAHNPRGLRYIIDFLHPGVVIRRRILVLNQESKKERFTVYPDAATIKRGYFIGDAGHTRSELTRWIKVQHPRVTLAPGASVMDLVTIRVPRIATRGEHYGVIWVQQTAHARSASGFGITEIDRVGVRIYLAVGRGGAPPTRFVITSVSGHRSGSGNLTLTALVHNTGGRAVDLSGTVRLADGPGGTTAGPFPVQQVVTLAPGQSMPIRFVPPRTLPAGPWQAKVTLVSGLTVAHALATISFSGHTPTAAWLRPGVMMILAVVIILLAVGGLLTIRRARARGLRARHSRPGTLTT